MEHFTIPIPPSTNQLYRNATGRDNKRGRIKTQRYLIWQREALNEIANQKVGRVPGSVIMEIYVPRKREGRNDIDNRIKAAADICVEAGVIDDDRDIKRISAEWVEGDKASIFIWPVEDRKAA